MWMVIIRCIIMYLMVILAVRLMGKRQIGELQPSELVITILISELASMPIQDKHLTVMSAVIPIFVLVGLEILTSLITLKSIRIRTFMYGNPLILVYKGEFRRQAMENARVTIDDIMEVMRNNGIADLAEVDYAVLETNGQLSIIQRENCRALTAEDVNIELPKSTGLPYLVIMDGKILDKNIKACNLSIKWLMKKLSEYKIKSASEVFVMTVDDEKNVYVVPKK